jgi:hypothetical protein
MRPSNEVPFETWDLLLAARERLLTEGWEVVPCDEPGEGVRGFAAYKAGEPDAWLWWPFLGRRLTPRVTVCSTWEQFVTELEFRSSEEMAKADDLESAQVGFVSYGRAGVDGTSEVFRVPVSVLTAGGPEARARLIKVLTSSKHPGAEGLRKAGVGSPSE